MLQCGGQQVQKVVQVGATRYFPDPFVCASGEIGFVSPQVQCRREEAFEIYYLLWTSATRAYELPSPERQRKRAPEFIRSPTDRAEQVSRAIFLAETGIIAILVKEEHER